MQTKPKVGEYYWIKVELRNKDTNQWRTSEWEVCYCLRIPSFKNGIGFEQIGIEGTAYPIDSIVECIHIPYPEETEDAD